MSHITITVPEENKLLSDGFIILVQQEGRIQLENKIPINKDLRKTMLRHLALLSEEIKEAR